MNRIHVRLERRPLREVFPAKLAVELYAFVNSPDMVPPQAVPVEFFAADLAREFPSFVHRGHMKLEATYRPLHLSALIAGE